MPNGFCPNLLKHISETGLTDPEKKLRNLGFLQMLFCCMDGSVNGLNDGYTNGHSREVDIWYRQRFAGDVLSADPGCDVGNNQPRLEFTLPALQTSAVALWFSVDDVRQYCEDASNPVTFGTTSLMKDMYSQIVSAMFKIMDDVDKKVITSMSTQFGKNLVTGSNAATVISYNPETAFQDIIKKVILDIQNNEFCADPCIVGNGKITEIDLERAIAASVAAAGYNPQALFGLLPTIYRDNATATAWGVDQFGVFEKGSLALINRLKYVGNFQRQIANSKYFTVAAPVNEAVCPQDCLDAFKFDIRVTEIDCAKTMTINGVEKTVENGYQVVISKDYELFVKPDLYSATDELSGTNGTLLYEATEAVAEPAA